MDYIDPKKITYLPNTAGCFTSEDALRTLRLAREIGGWKLVKLEVLGDKKNLFPDMIETLRSTEILTKERIKVMVYCSDDPLMPKRLEDSGAVAIMPLGAPIGSLLLGSSNFIAESKRIRKSFGGGMRQVGYLAAAGKYALQHHVNRLEEDHLRAQKIGSILKTLHCVETLRPVETNIVIFF